MPDKKILNPSSSGMDIPDAAIERIARVMLPMIQKYYESDEGKMELETWNETHKRNEGGKKMASERIEKLLAMQRESRSAETKSRAAAQGGETQNLYSEKQGKDASLSASVAGIWSIICPIQNC
ncbi:MAG: hypothetical protein ACLUHE_02515 [Christensenellales bacterium]